MCFVAICSHVVKGMVLLVGCANNDQEESVRKSFNYLSYVKGRTSCNSLELSDLIRSLRKIGETHQSSFSLLLVASKTSSKNSLKVACR